MAIVIIRWASLGAIVCALGSSVWLYIVYRRAGRQFSPILTTQVILGIGAAVLVVAGLADGPTELVMACVGGMLVAFAAGRTWELLRGHLRDVGLTTPRTESHTPDSAR